jgi:hypothetical protein
MTAGVWAVILIITGTIAVTFVLGFIFLLDFITNEQRRRSKKG